jgi:hypothetical protein
MDSVELLERVPSRDRPHPQEIVRALGLRLAR